MFADNLVTISKKLYMRRIVQPQPMSLPERMLHTLQQQTDSMEPQKPLRNQWTRSKQSRAFQVSTLHQRRLAGFEAESVPGIEHASRIRHLTPRNQIVGGVFMHQTRRKETIFCSARFPKKLAQTCQSSKAAGKAIQGNMHP